MSNTWKIGLKEKWNSRFDGYWPKPTNVIELRHGQHHEPRKLAMGIGERLEQCVSFPLIYLQLINNTLT